MKRWSGRNGTEKKEQLLNKFVKTMSKKSKKSMSAYYQRSEIVLKEMRKDLKKKKGSGLRKKNNALSKKMKGCKYLKIYTVFLKRIR